MSVTVQRNVRVRNYQGLPDNYRGPTGDFLCAAQVTGDNSAGTVGILMNATANIASKYVWHVHGAHVSIAPSVGMEGVFQQVGGESEYVSQGIVPGIRFLTVINGLGISYLDYNFHSKKEFFPMTEVANGLTLVWQFSFSTNTNLSTYQASIWGHVFKRQIFRLGGPLVP